MKIDFFIHERFKEPEIRICNNKLTDEMERLKEIIGKSINTTLVGFDDREMKILQTSEIERIYAANQKTIAVTDKGMEYTLHTTLAELETILEKNHFLRISRSEIINIHKIKKLDTKYAGTIKVILSDGEETYVSRRNVTKIKKALGI